MAKLAEETSAQLQLRSRLAKKIVTMFLDGESPQSIQAMRKEIMWSVASKITSQQESQLEILSEEASKMISQIMDGMQKESLERKLEALAKLRFDVNTSKLPFVESTGMDMNRALYNWFQPIYTKHVNQLIDKFLAGKPDWSEISKITFRDVKSWLYHGIGTARCTMAFFANFSPTYKNHPDRYRFSSEDVQAIIDLLSGVRVKQIEVYNMFDYVYKDDAVKILTALLKISNQTDRGNNVFNSGRTDTWKSTLEQIVGSCESATLVTDLVPASAAVSVPASAAVAFGCTEVSSPVSAQATQPQATQATQATEASVDAAPAVTPAPCPAPASDYLAAVVLDTSVIAAPVQAPASVLAPTPAPAIIVGSCESAPLVAELVPASAAVSVAADAAVASERIEVSPQAQATVPDTSSAAVIAAPVLAPASVLAPTPAPDLAVAAVDRPAPAILLTAVAAAANHPAAPAPGGPAAKKAEEEKQNLEAYSSLAAFLAICEKSNIAKGKVPAVASTSRPLRAMEASRRP